MSLDSQRPKSEYVRGQRQTRNHTCHWPGCETNVPPAMWGCKAHWFKIPKRLRDRIWDTYEIGQEVDMTPSDEYLAVAHEVQDWITANDGRPAARAAQEALCRAAGWEYCSEHDRNRSGGPNPCWPLHGGVEMEHAYWCPSWDGRDCGCSGAE